MNEATTDELVLTNVLLADYLAHAGRVIGGAGARIHALAMAQHPVDATRLQVRDTHQLLNEARHLEDAGTQLAQIAADLDGLQDDYLRPQFTAALDRLLAHEQD